MPTTTGNAYYRQLSDNSWIKQDGGGPAHMLVQYEPISQTWGVLLQYDGGLGIFVSLGLATSAAAQSDLNIYAAAMNAGTA
jgi:hypothetical protein